LTANSAAATASTLRKQFFSFVEGEFGAVTYTITYKLRPL
jgi:hypothetical protein